MSIRDIARHAGVNHGLVHRHFGGKSELLLHVFQVLRLDVAESATRAVSGEDDPQRLLAEIFLATGRNQAFFRILARSILDGEDPFAHANGFPIAAILVDTFTHLARAGRLSPGLRPEVAAATVMATTLGWHLFAPLILRSTGVGRSRRKAAGAEILAALLAQIGPTAESVIAPPPRTARSPVGRRAVSRREVRP